METPNTGSVMWKPLIKHQHSTIYAKSIDQMTKFHTIDHLCVRECASKQWIHRTHDQKYKKHKSYNSMTIAGVRWHNSQTAGQSSVGMRAFYTINIRNSFHHIYVYWHDLRLRLCNQNYCSVYVYITSIIDNWSINIGWHSWWFSTEGHMMNDQVFI